MTLISSETNLSGHLAVHDLEGDSRHSLSALNEKGHAGFVMANFASDARSSEQELRRQLIASRAVDVMVAVGPNLFTTVLTSNSCGINTNPVNTALAQP
jgi:hypothetical protein